MFEKLRKIFYRHPAPLPDRGDVMALFRRKYTEFKTLLESNAELLKIIAGMEEKLSGHHLFGMAYIRSEMVRALFHCGRMIAGFETLSGRAQVELKQALDHIRTEVDLELKAKKTLRGTDLVLPFSAITRDMVDYVGGKSANLGEIKGAVSLPVPRGFAVTTTAFDEFVAHNDLLDEIRKEKMELEGGSPEAVVRVSEKICAMFRKAQLPPALEQAIAAAYREEISPSGEIKVALRSSALGEDGELSFAGQYQSIMNVPPQEIMAKYKEVLASLFSPRAISYRLHMGISFEDAAMSVMCLEMVRAKTAGVAYTRHPFDPLKERIIITAVWGLGATVVDGKASGDIYELSKDAQPMVLERRIASKKERLVLDPDGGLTSLSVEPELQELPCLTDRQARLLAADALKLEAHYQFPQDIEWALDFDEKLYILQTRPLLITERKMTDHSVRHLEKYPPLLDGGDVACPGVAFGPAHLIHEEEDLIAFPDGAVLVAAHSSPRYAVAMGKARAIVTDSGSIAGHMASLAREFKIPTLLNTRNGTAVITSGMPVTVDALSGKVYGGKVSELLSIRWERGAYMKKTPVHQTLEKLTRHIIPLNLTDPKSSRFSPKYCRTVHDIMRFIHERSYGHIFQISDFSTDYGRISVKLSAPLPVDLYIIDLGDGLATGTNASDVTPEKVLSKPFKALLEGMLNKGLKPLEPRPINMGGFFSVVRQQMLSPPNGVEERFGDKSYAVISDKYLNFSSRVGYHYSNLDCYCGNMAVKNYITFQFAGGAADDLRRHRRARLIKTILDANGFLVEVTGDRVAARFVKQPSADIIKRLDLLGRLLIYSRQMDMLMNSEESVAALADQFLTGRYDLKKTSSGPGGEKEDLRGCIMD